VVVDGAGEFGEGLDVDAGGPDGSRGGSREEAALLADGTAEVEEFADVDEAGESECIDGPEIVGLGEGLEDDDAAGEVAGDVGLGGGETGGAVGEGGVGAAGVAERGGLGEEDGGGAS
jgi:hypothetical protein